MSAAIQAETPNLTLVASNAAPQMQPRESIDGVEFLQAITASLELDHVVRTAMGYLSELVALRSWEYRYQSAEFEAPLCQLSDGKVDRHQVEYTLGSAGQPMGHLTLTRGRRFSEQEQEKIESLLGLAAPALRNALRFNELSLQLETDPMTGLGNRRALHTQGERWLSDSERQHRPLTMLALDLDRFKPINDRFGHPEGDRLLCQVARVLRESTRPSDVCVRMGGDEFVVLVPGADVTSAMDCAERIRQAIGEIELSAPEAAGVRVSASIGLAMHHEGMTLDQLYNQADSALYAAKHAGSNRVLAGGRSSVAKPELRIAAS
ncbi:GGDEF domain-containing protein [Thiorhodovibrio frisius]|uniref:diguanylate cyclase n=1 Tax=Thiorhodovibrio frisius TaxID=631362 RepID=H8YX20_9GAMM|nr:GGDEF domain-containing protein [Thiorhodovibrio frisius]EIC22996.1 diguanylate cyclase (GGDEF) domain-containing protein [Thiorhodovibrio frisius]WPL22736.1 putative diguanylate cyclase YedQ [Thiorhodovibrio frisius]